MPYVQQHVQRYHHEETRRMKKATNIVTKKRQVQEETLEMARASKPDPVRRGRNVEWGEE